MTLVSYLMPEGFFQFLVVSSGAIALLAYLVIAVSQFPMRKMLHRQRFELTFNMWWFAWLTWLVIVFICTTLVVVMVAANTQ